jgi:hypothetical protein
LCILLPLPLDLTTMFFSCFECLWRGIAWDVSCPIRGVFVWVSVWYD